MQIRYQIQSKSVIKYNPNPYQIESKSVIKHNPNPISNTIQIQSKSGIKHNPNPISNRIQIRYQIQSKSGTKYNPNLVSKTIKSAQNFSHKLVITRSTIKKLSIFPPVHKNIIYFYTILFGNIFRETENPNFLTKP